MDFENDDFVRFKLDSYSEYAKDVIWDENVFRILSIKGKYVKLLDVINEVPLDAIEPIPIDGCADSCIYYDPVIAADIIPYGKPVPVRKKDMSYFVDGFEKMHIDGHTLKDEFISLNFKYVHEVQHWLRESSVLEELQLNKTLKSNVLRNNP